MVCSLYSIHYVLYNVEDTQTDRQTDGAGVLTQDQFGHSFHSVHLFLGSVHEGSHCKKAVDWSSDHMQHRGGDKN